MIEEIDQGMAMVIYTAAIVGVSELAMTLKSLGICNEEGLLEEAPSPSPPGGG